MKRPLALVALAIAGFVFGISGCGDNDDSSPGTTSGTVTTGQSLPTNTGRIDTGRTNDSTDSVGTTTGEDDKGGGDG